MLLIVFREARCLVTAEVMCGKSRRVCWEEWMAGVECQKGVGESVCVEKSRPAWLYWKKCDLTVIECRRAWPARRA